MNKVLYEQLVQYILENQNRFYRLAYSYTKNQEDALDAVQNAVCKALEAFESIRNTGAIKTWFYRILINECLRMIQKRKKDSLTADYEELDTVYYEKA
ncbi:MAG: sigma-70 family RNA polymerase sigma factor [Faecousia sp.]